MILFEINAQDFAVIPFKGDTPRPVHMNAVTLRPATEEMEIETGQVHLFQPLRLPKDV